MGAGGDRSDTPNYGQLISSLRATGNVAADIEALDETVSVWIVLLSDLRGRAAENAAALDQVLADQEERLAEFRSAIEANATLSAALEAEGDAADDVVAVSSIAGGEVTLIVGAEFKKRVRQFWRTFAPSARMLPRQYGPCPELLGVR